MSLYPPLPFRILPDIYTTIKNKIMARIITLSMHVSLDGYVAGPNGEMDWIKIDDEIFSFVDSKTDEADTALYGRKTYEIMDNYWPTADQKPDAGKHARHHAAWYKSVTKVVLSRTMKSDDPKTRVISENVPEQVRALKEEPGRNILIFGSPGASQVLIEHNLIDEYWLFVNPVAINKGIPLFRQDTLQRLKLVNSHVYASGVIWLHYRKL